MPVDPQFMKVLTSCILKEYLGISLLVLLDRVLGFVFQEVSSEFGARNLSRETDKRIFRAAFRG
jgi:hypothetical protein